MCRGLRRRVSTCRTWFSSKPALAYLTMDQYLYIPFLGDEHPFTSYFDVHQGYKVLTHCHLTLISWNLSDTHTHRVLMGHDECIHVIHGSNMFQHQNPRCKFFRGPWVMLMPLSFRSFHSLPSVLALPEGTHSNLVFRNAYVLQSLGTSNQTHQSAPWFMKTLPIK